MEGVREFLEISLLTIGGYDITMAQVLLVPTFLLVGYLVLGWVTRLAAAAMMSRGVSPDLVQVLRRGIYVLGLVVLVITAFEMLNVPLTAFAFVSGAVAIGIGFGAQNIINNFISGWILMWERPIRINDYIELGDTTGSVEQINTRSTRIRRVDGVHLLVPNSRLLEETVVNWTLVDRLVRSIVRVGVAYGSNVELVREVLTRVAIDHQQVLDDPPPQVIFEDFGDSALVFDIYYWVESGGEKGAREIRSDLRFAIDRAFAENDIVIAFPQRDVHMDGSLVLRQEG